MNTLGYIITNGETFSPTRDERALLLFASELRVAQERIKNPQSSAVSSDVNFAVSLSNVGACSVATATIFNLPPQSEPEEDIWQAFERVLADFSEDILSDLPKDLSTEHDHYLYGTPKKS